LILTICHSVDTTPLHHAAATGQVEVIELLLNKYFCDIEAKDSGRSTPLCLATLAGKFFFCLVSSLHILTFLFFSEFSLIFWDRI